MNHLANQAIPLELRTEAADAALALVNALVEERIAEQVFLADSSTLNSMRYNDACDDVVAVRVIVVDAVKQIFNAMQH